MSEQAYPTLDVTHAQRELPNLWRQVAGNKDRVEITQPGSSERCVIISKSELQGLEHALEILSNAPDVKEMRNSLAALAALAWRNSQPATP